MRVVLFSSLPESATGDISTSPPLIFPKTLSPAHQFPSAFRVPSQEPEINRLSPVNTLQPPIPSSALPRMGLEENTARSTLHPLKTFPQISTFDFMTIPVSQLDNMFAPINSPSLSTIIPFLLPSILFPIIESHPFETIPIPAFILFL